MHRPSSHRPSSHRPSSHRHSLEKLKTDQKQYFDGIKQKLDTLDTLSISELQLILKPLLNNVFIDGYNLDDEFVQKYIPFNLTNKNNKNIFNIPISEYENSTFDKTKYKNFLIFMIKKLYENNTEFSHNEGSILTSHILDGSTSEDIKEINKIKQIYEDTYNLKDDTWTQVSSKSKTIKRKLNTVGKKYPFYMTNLKSHFDNIYTQHENAEGILPINEQTDEQFLITLKKRIDGLEKCSKQNLSNEDFYKNEFHSEKNKYEEQIKKNKYDNGDNNSNVKDIKEILKEICTNIIWGPSHYEYNATFTDEDKCKQLLDFTNALANPDNSNELTFTKTFLPETCFNDDGSLKPDKLLELITTKNNKNRQYILGFEDEIQKYIPIKQFYEIYNFINTGYVEPCSVLVSWNILSNLMLVRCCLSNNDETVIFPIRFILKMYDSLKPKFKNQINNDTTQNISIRHTTNTINIFTSPDYKMVGLIIIKYYHEQTHTYRNWILFIIKNTKDKYIFDYTTGKRLEYSLLNNTFGQVNPGSLLEKPSATYQELKFLYQMSKKYNNILFYISTLDNNIMFVRVNKQLNEEDCKKYNVYQVNLNFNEKFDDFNKNIFTITKVPSLINTLKGGNLTHNIKIKLTHNINVFNDNLSNGIYKQFITTRLSNTILNMKYIDIFNIIKTLYNYVLVSPNDIIFRNLLDSNYYNKYIITKYRPLYYYYYITNEIFIKYNIINNLFKNDNILNIGNDITPIELLINNNYKFKNIDNIVVFDNHFYNNLNNYINKLTSIYNININYFNDKIIKLLNFDDTKQNSYKLIIYTVYETIGEFFMYNNFYNTINIFIGMMISLKYTIRGGTFILYLGNVAYKPSADIYLILKPYFEESSLYYPEIANKYKENSIFGIFKNFKGINNNEYNKLFEILNKLNKLYPDNLITNFNIYDKEQREYFKSKISKPINETKKEKYITGFLPVDTDYSEIIDFNNSIYPSKLSFLQKFINRYNNPIAVPFPTQDQILSSILYCRKYDIPIFDKYSIKAQDTTITKTILHDLYGLHEPILYKFKTPFHTHIANKIVFHPKFKSIKPSSIIKKHSKNYKSNSFFNDLFTNETHKQSKHKSTKHKSTSRTKKLRQSNMSLEEAVFNSNNQLVQVGRLIDVRKDFTKANPTELYDKLKDQLRYYKGWTKAKPGQKSRNVPDLTDKVQTLLHDYSISQAWLKMYEIITDCNLIPTNRKGIYKTFHICEAPGTFISCINNYIHTKTSYDTFEWKAQSLKPKGVKSHPTTIGDTYGLIKKYPYNWDFGIDNTGDITNIENIKYYAKIAKDMNINLMTSDCGLPWGDPKYYQVAYASYVSILYSLPQNGTMLYKILSPIDIPLIWNLIYITYRNFKELYFFKPVQNSQSREFYIIGKGYLGTEQSVLDKLLNIIPKFEENNTTFNKEEYDLFNDTYPDDFVIQVQNICEKLAANYVNSIERIIYYVDNIDDLGKEYQKHIESYMKEKNEDWVRRYKVMRVDNKFIL
jgi:hypothetical protein